MFSQHEHDHVLSDASQTRQILTPLSDGSLNSDNVFGAGEKKRKRDESSAAELLKDHFVVKPYPSQGAVRSRKLQPLLLLPRSHLPLSSLDFTTPSASSLPMSRAFESHIKILELEERMGTQPMVLIARLDDGLTLYAVERQDSQLYVLCKLGSWVNIQQLRAVSVVSRQEVKATERKSISGISPIIPQPVPKANVHSSKKRLAIETLVSMVKRPHSGITPDSQTDTTPLSFSQPSLNTTQIPDPALPADEAAAPRTAAEIFENVRNQYFEALYLSKGSLAYFVKGPLARARALFHLDYDSTLDMNEYMEFLEGLVLSTSMFEKKYKNGIPECISLIDVHDDDADATKLDEKPKKRKVNKKMKPGKTGLYPGEDATIRKWWAGHDDDVDFGAPGSSKSEVSKRRANQLRTRETQLQMIVILEVLALQPLLPVSEDTTNSLPGVLLADTTEQEKEKTPKTKKPDHLSKLIDFHIDRLCIWQSLDLESTETPVEGQSDKLGRPNSTNKYADNVLGDFCVDIIRQFFSSRLPERCAMINQKLGGPVPISPPMQTLKKSSSFSGALSRPGAATKRPIPAKPRRSLQRVLTDDRERRSGSFGHARAPSLLRSATDPVKREASETPSLMGIPRANSPAVQVERKGILASKQFSRREVDMSRLISVPEERARKKAKMQADVDAELSQAIYALKKPNRELAGKLLVETAEKRAVPAPPLGRKSKKPVRNPLFQGVQIKATPTGNRKKDVFASSGPRVSKLPKMEEEMNSPSMISPSSAPPMIPGSSVRPSRESARDSVMSVQATPTRRGSTLTSQQSNGMLGVPSMDDALFLPSSPLQQRRSSVQQHNAVLDSAVKSTASAYIGTIEDTPVKKRAERQTTPQGVAGGSNKENATTGKTTSDDIYKALGWDDDDCDELA